MKDHSAHLWAAAAATAKLLQSCPTLCNPIDGSPLGSSVGSGLQNVHQAENSHKTWLIKRFSERILTYHQPRLFKRRTYKPDHISDFNLNGLHTAPIRNPGVSFQRLLL